MRLDEKIALLERERRQQEKEEKLLEEQKENELKEQVKKLTLEEAMEGIHTGEHRLETGELFEFETRTFTDSQIPVVTFRNFFEASQEEAEGVIYVSHTHEVSQILSWPKETIKPVTMKQWANLLVNGMAANRLHAKIVKTEELDFVDYICFDVPSGKDTLYNIVFRLKGTGQQFTGNYNCKKQDEDTYGVFLEAMVITLNNLFLAK
ncbi:hypothetical protein [Lacrimispora sp.]|uniref:hypothetical protein n=1 Tax=Lacrimispora sp. TaxID=2719234 RepID=UPI0029E52625|nr:hypothetical protein [Lacrimispora sp.]